MIITFTTLGLSDMLQSGVDCKFSLLEWQVLPPESEQFPLPHSGSESQGNERTVYVLSGSRKELFGLLLSEWLWFTFFLSRLACAFACVVLHQSQIAGVFERVVQSRVRQMNRPSGILLGHVCIEFLHVWGGKPCQDNLTQRRDDITTDMRLILEIRTDIHLQVHIRQPALLEVLGNGEFFWRDRQSFGLIGERIAQPFGNFLAIFAIEALAATVRKSHPSLIASILALEDGTFIPPPSCHWPFPPITR